MTLLLKKKICRLESYCFYVRDNNSCIANTSSLLILPFVSFFFFFVVVVVVMNLKAFGKIAVLKISLMDRWKFKIWQKSSIKLVCGL